MAAPLAAADALAEGAHAGQHRVHLGSDIDLADRPSCVGGTAQRHVQRCARLGAVDALAGEHCLHACGQPDLIDECKQQGEFILPEQVLRVIERDPAGACLHACGPCRIVAEEGAQHRQRMGGTACLQGPPGGQLLELGHCVGGWVFDAWGMNAQW